MAAANKVLPVVAAAIFNKQSDLLITQRPLDKHMGGLWEFPGGKLEAGEAATEALCRKLDEELGIACVVGFADLYRTYLSRKNSSARCLDRQRFSWRSPWSGRASRKMGWT